MVYDSDAKQDPSLTAVAADTTFTRWDIALSDSRVLSLAPFYVAPPPGRVTFASFVVPPSAVNGPTVGAQFCHADTLGFVKFSWQDEARTWKERELLDRLHKKGWFPGVVRHHPSQLSHSGPAIRQLGLDDGTSRAFEMLHLGSIGEPLSQCKTPEEILMAAYDILQTSLNMLELDDIIHRDLSWFNVFCKPEHDPQLGGKERKLDRPFIASILGEGDGPSALVADFDHSAILKALMLRSGASRKEKTGTPMFRSLELSCPLDLGGNYNTTNINFSFLIRAFKAIEHPDYRTSLLTAFPNDNLTFAATFAKIAEMDLERRYLLRDGDESQRYTVPDLPHAARHDAESMYWISLWALVRALPLRVQDVLTSNYNDFCEAMLMEGSPIPGTGNRKRYLLQACVGALLHPDLRYFEGGLLEHMATYFSIPWGLYGPELGPHHAHSAMRRLLLFALLQDKPALRVKLNTERVRHCNATIFSIQTPEYSAPVSTFATMAHTLFDTTGASSQFSGLSAVASNSPLANNNEEDTDVVQQTIVAQKRPASSALSQCVLTGAADPGEAPATKRAKLSITARPRADA